MQEYKAMSQAGRSMIEMLGVLAIVGVLSIGAIAGYSKAFYKFKINRTMEDLSSFVANVKEKFANVPSYTNLDSKLAYNLALFTDDMVKHCESISDVANINPSSSEETSGGDKIVVSTVNSIGTTCLSSWLGGGVAISANSDGNSFAIAFDKVSKEACVTLANQEWDNNSGFDSLTVTAGGSDQVKVLRNMDKGTAVNSMAKCNSCGGGDCIAVWTFL